MTNEKQSSNQERREFIKKSTLLGAGAVAAGMASTQAIADVSGEITEKPAQKGYQLTQHVVNYYKSADI